MLFIPDLGCFVHSHLILSLLLTYLLATLLVPFPRTQVALFRAKRNCWGSQTAMDILNNREPNFLMSVIALAHLFNEDVNILLSEEKCCKPQLIYPLQKGHELQL